MKKKLIATAIALVLVLTVLIFSRLFLVRTVEVRFAVAPADRSVAEEIVTVAEVGQGQSILNLDEDRIIANVANHFKDNSVVVKSVERVFPDTVILHVTAYHPAVAVPLKDGQSYAITDAGFQMSQIVEADRLQKDSYIVLSGTAVDSSFNTPDLIAVNKFFRALELCGMKQEALPYFIASIECADRSLQVSLRDGKTMTIGFGDINGDTVEAYRAYLQQ